LAIRCVGFVSSDYEGSLDTYTTTQQLREVIKIKGVSASALSESPQVGGKTSAYLQLMTPLSPNLICQLIGSTNMALIKKARGRFWLKLKNIISWNNYSFINSFIFLV